LKNRIKQKLAKGQISQKVFMIAIKQQDDYKKGANLNYKLK